MSSGQIDYRDLEYRPRPQRHEYLARIPASTWVAVQRKIAKGQYQSVNHVINELLVEWVLGRVDVAKQKGKT